MKFQFVKSILACSVFALGSVALTACGGDSSSSADEGDSSSSAEPLVLSSVSETSPLDAGSKVVAAATADGQGGYYLSLSGIIKTDSEMFPDPEGYDGEDPVYYNIDSLQFDVGDMFPAITSSFSSITKIPKSPNCIRERFSSSRFFFPIFLGFPKPVLM
ncbi:MAG: hypothetical protein IJ982_04525, partial [Fibrobacter sp.]|nr:hypothetical protein [Fibrobacter sp.]